MKLKEAVFCGFTKKELSRIREAKGSGEREVSLTDSQDIADIVEADVMTMITPGGQITELIKVYALFDIVYKLDGISF